MESRLRRESGARGALKRMRIRGSRAKPSARLRAAHSGQGSTGRGRSPEGETETTVWAARPIAEIKSRKRAITYNEAE